MISFATPSYDPREQNSNFGFTIVSIKTSSNGKMYDFIQPHVFT